MKNLNKKILALAFISYVAMITPAFAVIKLEATGPAADSLNKIEHYKEKYEDIQSKVLKEKEKWTKKVNGFLENTLGTEGAALFNEYVVKPGAGIVQSAAQGQFSSGDYSLSGFSNAMKSQLGEFKLDYATLVAQSKDMIETAERAKLEKVKALEVQRVKLRAEWEAKNQLNVTLQSPELSEELLRLGEEIADIDRQIALLSNERIVESDQQKQMQSDMLELQKNIADLSGKFSQEELVKKLQQESFNLFSGKSESEENELLYAAALDKLFLGKYDFSTSENVAKLRKARYEEFYKSEKNMINVIVETYNSMKNTEEHMKKCAQASENAQALFGGSAMRVCVDIQVTKIAAQYMEMLLAQMRLQATAEIQQWTDKYKLPEGERDYTTFNMDDYVITKSDLSPSLKDKASGAINDAMSKFKGF